MNRIACAVLILTLVGCAKAPPAVDLRIALNDKCSTCDDYIRCDAATNPAIYDPTFDVYHLQPKGTLAQIATIFDYLLQFVRTKSEDQRPLAVHSQRPGTINALDRTSAVDQLARLDLVKHRIQLPGGAVDQITGDWLDQNGEVRGACRLLSRTEGEAVLALFESTTPAAEPAT